MIDNEFRVIMFVQTPYMDDIDAIGKWTDIQFNGLPVAFHVGNPFAIKVEQFQLVDQWHEDFDMITGGIGNWDGSAAIQFFAVVDGHFIGSKVDGFVPYSWISFQIGLRLVGNDDT